MQPLLALVFFVSVSILSVHAAPCEAYIWYDSQTLTRLARKDIIVMIAPPLTILVQTVVGAH